MGGKLKKQYKMSIFTFRFIVIIYKLLQKYVFNSNNDSGAIGLSWKFGELRVVRLSLAALPVWPLFPVIGGNKLLINKNKKYKLGILKMRMLNKPLAHK